MPALEPPSRPLRVAAVLLAGLILALTLAWHDLLPGAWTLRVIEHNVRPDAPDWPDEVEEFSFMVTGQVPGESVSFGAIKALYR